MKRLLAAAAAIVGMAALLRGHAVTGQEKGTPAPEAAPGMSLVFLGDKQPVLLRVHVLMDGRPIEAVWHDYFRKWFEYFDLDSDGLLSAQEAQAVPNAAGMAQAMRQGLFGVGRTQPIDLGRDLGKKPGEKATRAEFVSYFLKSVGPIQYAAPTGLSASLKPAGDVIFKHLDLNRDGKISQEEFAAAAKNLRKFDVDDDELIKLTELAPQGGNPAFGVNAVLVLGNQPAATRLHDAFYHLIPGEPVGSFVALLMARYDNNKDARLSRSEIGLDAAAFARLDLDNDAKLDANELARWHVRPADVEIKLHLSKSDSTPSKADLVGKPSVAVKVEQSGFALRLALDGSQLAFKAEGGAGQVLVANVSQFFLQQFRQADRNKQGFVLMNDLPPQMRGLFPLADRNKDGKLTEKELQSFLGFLSEGPAAYAEVSIAEHGRSWFQLLDANGDNHLSPRELLTAWKRLAHLDVDGDGCLSPEELTRHFHIVFGRGSGLARGIVLVQGTTTPPPARTALPQNVPAWFRKMDVNGDGDVSRREFLGSTEDFQRFDRDGDGLIDAQEAIAADAASRK